jgi:hypothetical protein
MNTFLNSTRKVASRYCRISVTIFTIFCGKSYRVVKETTCSCMDYSACIPHKQEEPGRPLSLILMAKM